MLLKRDNSFFNKCGNKTSYQRHVNEMQIPVKTSIWNIYFFIRSLSLLLLLFFLWLHFTAESLKFTWRPFCTLVLLVHGSWHLLSLSPRLWRRGWYFITSLKYPGLVYVSTYHLACVKPSPAYYLKKFSFWKGKRIGSNERRIRGQQCISGFAKRGGITAGL